MYAEVTESPARHLVGELFAATGRCSGGRHLRGIHAALLRRLDLLPSPSTFHRVFARLLRLAAATADLSYAARLLSSSIPLLAATGATHLPFYYNTLIRAISRLPSSAATAAGLYASMRRSGIFPDAFTFTFLLKSRSAVPVAGDIHAQAFKFGCADIHVQNALIHLHALCRRVDYARQVFDEMPERDVISWSAILNAHLKVNDVEAARRVFDAMPERDVVAWTAMIGGYTNAGQPRAALELFWTMQVPPDEVTMIAVVSACAVMGDLETGEYAHKCIDELGFGWMVSLQNALIDMYAKCGRVAKARVIFDRMGRKTLVTWNLMINAYSLHGNVNGAVELFHWMLEYDGGGWGLWPDGVTFLAVLNAFTHAGRVKDGWKMFEDMKNGCYGDTRLTVEHYGCVIDMLGRAGQIGEARRVVEEMPESERNHVVWGALLGACRMHGDIETAVYAAEKVAELKPTEGGYYALLSELYQLKGQPEMAAEVRRAMEHQGARKMTGHSNYCERVISGA